MSIKKIMVIGSGQMGSGVVQVLATAGYTVYMNDIKEESVQNGLTKIKTFLDKSVQRQSKTAEQVAEILERIIPSTSYDDAKDVDLVIEAATENKKIKLSIFKELDAIAPEHAILATNTSSLSITEIASVTNRPEKVIGMHFFNPVPLMKLVEINYGLGTSKETGEIIVEVADKIKKVSIDIKDSPGFAVNRILIPMINEAIFVLGEGIATASEIDEAMMLGANHPMGPLALADYIGLDTCLSIMNVLYEGFNDSKYRPAPLLKKYVEAGWLGNKVGKGFYDHKKGGK
ncbi:3-hydroxybutyryl-CoA dehydrogenase [Vagococcus penaei]|uniref:3-hydroxybutyryl-CoA dehydrogenase n=1 Tax=Vagococcus penaei TaxID=633807 RepID=A0A1Q2D8Q5_9ENTE|nr:3-hydroxybutyryl-CoA dehydrogenase [Vagococcus penaei]AQP54671.1 3-hydroxybutyryl-CoA dehydrogenase [Vagococcus penaei]RSU05323.1 3-hydroxybutyryl-CoA dehydrogenase [Vagococcus penaei]